jgi:hypothetical protein
MSFKVLAGPYMNSLVLAAAEPIMDPAAVATFPVGNLRDNRSALPAIFSVAQLDSSIVFDLNRVRGGSAEVAGDDTEWTPFLSGTVALSAAHAVSGAASLELSPLSGSMIAIQDIRVRAGEQLHFMASAGYTVDSNHAQVFVRNRQTGNFLQDDGTWAPPTASDGSMSSAGTPLVDGVAAGWSDVDLPFTVEPFSTCKHDVVTLRIFLYSEGVGYFDDLALWPLNNWCSIHGHNLSPFIVPKLQSSDDGTTWATEATMTIKPDSFYSALGSMLDHRYWNLLLEGYPYPSPLTYLGEVVLGQSFDLLHNPAYGGSISWNDRQTRLETAMGESWVYLHNARALRLLSMSFVFRNDAEYVQFRDAVFRGSRGGANPIVIAPIEEDSDQVILGKIQEAVTVTKPALRTADLEVIESPLPNMPDPIHAFDLPIEGEPL